MAQIDDLRAVLRASNDKLTEMADKVDAVQVDIQVLINRLGQVSPPIPDDIMESAVALQNKIGTVADDLDSTPKAPEE